MKKLRFPTELAYLVGVTVTMIGIAAMAKSGYGVSMVAAPSYVLHLKISQFLPFYTFGVSQYCVEAMLLVLMCCLLRHFQISYLFSFVTSFWGGNMLDLCGYLLGFLPTGGYILRAVYFCAGVVIIALGVSFVFHTYISQQVYELFVQEMSRHLSMKTHVFKWYYDVASLIVGAILMVIFFGFHLVGIGAGTLICALVTGPIIGVICNWMNEHLDFYDMLPFRPFFEKHQNRS